MTVPMRERILREHAELRTRLDEIDALLGGSERNAEAAVTRLRERGLALYRRLREHIDLEDRILAPALRAGGCDGAERADDLEREHAEQRELLAFLIGRLGEQQRPAILTVRELRGFVDYLWEDMAREEAVLLSGVPLAATDGDSAWEH